MGSKHIELFLRKEEGSDSKDVDEKWDDSLLVDAYNKAVAKAKRELLKKIQKEDNLTNEEIRGVISEDNSESEDSKPTKKKDDKKKSKLSIAKNSDWRLGDFCRAVYSEDGIEYEAQITRKIDGNCCVVKFIGYNNEEEVYLNELMPSMGKTCRKLQEEMAESDLNKELEEGELEEEELKSEEESESMSENESVFEPNTWSYFPNFADPRTTRSIHPQPPPPPPPVPPSMLNAFPEMMRPPNLYPRTSDANLDSLLMSWYMCGYYTGYYAREMKN